jgi:hypothetical protein
MKRRAGRVAGAVVSLAVAALPAGCRAAADLEIRYEDCVSPAKPYIEGFEEGYAVLPDRCWKPENVEDEAAQLVVGEDNDFTIKYPETGARPQTWLGNPPGFVRRIEGDFILVAQVEAVRAIDSFCAMEPGDAAGLVVRPAGPDGGESGGAALLVRPLLPDAAACEGEPRAIAELKGPGSPETKAASDAFGADGEGEIALCRHGDKLAAFYLVRGSAERDAGEAAVPVWQPLEPEVAVGEGPVDAGLTVTATETGVGRSVQGTFNWTAVLVEGAAVTDCLDRLDEFNAPAE